MQTQTDIRRLLSERGLSPRKSLGQHFLIDHNLLTKLIDASDVRPGDVVLEVGPGAGALTETLLDRGCLVVACELDDGLCDLLDELFFDAIPDKLTLIRGDCLRTKHELAPAIVDTLAGRPFKLVANLPYGCASPLLITLLTQHRACSAMCVTIQAEVATRLLATHGTKDFGELSVIMQALATVKRVASAPPSCFWPRPAVHSAMIRITPRETPLTDDPQALIRCCHTLFGQRRKQIGSILGREREWPPGVSGDMRAEQLSVEQIIALSRLLT